MFTTKKIVNSFLVIIFLMATTGVTLNKHYCMGKLKSVVVSEHAQRCSPHEDEQMPCCKCKDVSQECCKDVGQEFKVEGIIVAFFDYDPTPDLSKLATVNFILSKKTRIVSENEKSHFQHYSPPFPDKDLPVLIQSFLI